MCFLLLGLSSCQTDSPETKLQQSSTEQITTENRTQREPCKGPEASDVCPNFYDVPGILNIGGCSIPYTYNYQRCNTGGGVIWGLKIGEIPSSCDLFDLIDNFILNNQLGKIRDTYNIIYSRLSFLLEQNLANSFLNMASDMQCSEDYIGFSVESIATACIQLNIKRIDGGGIILEESNCGSTCCTRTTQWCFTGTVLTQQTQVYGGASVPSCSSSGPANPWTGLALPCTYSCDRIYPIE